MSAQASTQLPMWTRAYSLRTYGETLRRPDYSSPTNDRNYRVRAVQAAAARCEMALERAAASMGNGCGPWLHHATASTEAAYAFAMAYTA